MLSALESKAEDLSTTFDHLDDEAEDDFHYDLLVSPGLAGRRAPMARSQSLLSFYPAGEDYRAQRGNLADSSRKSFTGSTTSLDLDKKIKAELKKTRLARESQKRLSLDAQHGDLLNPMNDVENGREDASTIDGLSSEESGHTLNSSDGSADETTGPTQSETVAVIEKYWVSDF